MLAKHGLDGRPWTRLWTGGDVKPCSINQPTMLAKLMCRMLV